MTEDTRRPNVGDMPHEATRTEASDGYGTATNDRSPGPTQDRPIMDGATMSPEAEAVTENPERVTDEQPAAEEGSTSHDHDHDPALNDQEGSDWTDEGGATATGPATHSS